ncbi:cupredoxin domain-containing protein [Aquibacillus albus]|uniref:Cytochrome c oxidase subunit 2 n=1 Tax=Aquibacillus albus TaxID=1168171 RepID=A0ABS2MYY3_9BACI|nr:cupredoxin domain-containing protein [Aquibacillus albus]MBM7571092.1 cytochrome c oxidase subunit 2 [Aquibacillus albus]
MRKQFSIFIILSIFALLAACGTDTDNDTTQDNLDHSASESSNRVEIVATNFKFNQEEYTVQAGEPVTLNFTSDEGLHGISINELNVNIEGDGSATITPEEPGEYQIYCNVLCGAGHSDMVATLIVQ